MSEIDMDYDYPFVVKRCVVCLAPLNQDKSIYTGHVCKGDKWVSAGFCSEECYQKAKVDKKGCYGVWRKEYGLKEEKKEVV